MKAKIKILLDEYVDYYEALLKVQILIKALTGEGLSADMELEPRFASIGAGLPPVQTKVTIDGRIKELQRDEKILNARVEAIKKELIEVPDLEGEKALKDWENGNTSAGTRKEGDGVK